MKKIEINKYNKGLKNDDCYVDQAKDKKTNTAWGDGVPYNKLAKESPCYAINLNKTNYIVIDIDGNKEKQHDEIIKEAEKTLIILCDNLDAEGYKYRVDRTASGKFHVWLRWSNKLIDNKEFCMSEEKTNKHYFNNKFLKPDTSINDLKHIGGFIELFTCKDKHLMTLAGSVNSNDEKYLYFFDPEAISKLKTINKTDIKNHFQGITDDFSKLSEAPAVLDIINNTISQLEYFKDYSNIKHGNNGTNSVSFDIDNTSYYINVRKINGVYNCSFKDANKTKALISEEKFIKLENLEEFTGSLNDYYKSVVNMLNNCNEYNKIIGANEKLNNAIIKTFVSIIFYIQQQQNKSAVDVSDNTKIRNTSEVLEKLINLIIDRINELNGTVTNCDFLAGKRHEFFLALGNYVAKFCNIAEVEEIYNKITTAIDLPVDKIAEHKSTFLNDVQNKGNNEGKHLKGLSTVLRILKLESKEISFLNDVEKETTALLERLHPDPAKHEKGYKLFLRFFEANKQGKFKKLGIEPCDDILYFIVQIISLNVYNEKQAITTVLLALIGGIVGYNSLYLSATGGAGTGKSTIINACLDVLPDENIIKAGSLSKQYVYYLTQQSGSRVFDHAILDLGDKGDEAGQSGLKLLYGILQGLITEGRSDHGATRLEENKETGDRGVVNLTLLVDSFVAVATSIEKIDNNAGQIGSRTQQIETNPRNKQADIKKFNLKRERDVGASNFYELLKPLIKHFLRYQIATIPDSSIFSNIWNDAVVKWSEVYNLSNRKTERYINYLSTYSWVNAIKLNKINDNYNNTYIVPDAKTINEFKNSIELIINPLGLREKEFYNWLITKSNYNILSNMEAEQNIKNIRAKDLNVDILKSNNFFTKKIITNDLSDIKEDWAKQINISDTIDLFNTMDILTRLNDRDDNNYNIFYINEHDKKVGKTLTLNKNDCIKAKENIKGAKADNIELLGVEKCQEMLLAGSFENPNKFNIDNTDFLFNINFDNNDNNSGKEIVDKDNKNKSNTRDTANKTNNINDRTNNYINLHVHSCESVGDGACTIDQLINTAKENKQTALALTNHGTLNGLNYFNKRCKDEGIKAILGVEAYVTEERNHLVLLAENKQGYYDLLSLHNNAVRHIEETKKKTERYNGRYVNGGVYLNEFKLSDRYNNLTALSGCVAGAIPKLLLAGKYDEAKQKAINYNTIFNHFYLEIQEHNFKDQIVVNELLYKLSNETGIPLIVTGDVHYIDNIHNWELVQNAKYKHDGCNNSFKIDAPAAIAKNTIEVAKYIESYELNNNIQLPAGRGDDWLKDYCYNKLQSLKINDKKHTERLKEELRVITSHNLTAYHTVLYDIVKLLRTNNISIGGRGSAVGSLVCYLLGFHNIDPIKYDLLFERYLNDSRIEAGTLPDVDLNIESDKRDLALELIRNKYKNVAQISTYSEFSSDSKELFNRLERVSGADAIQLNGVKYQSGTHAGGIIISEKSFNDFMPLTFSKNGDIITDCDKHEVEALGGVKYDLLGDKQQIINKGVELTAEDLNDEKIINIIKEYPLAIFQFGNYSGVKWLKENNPQCFNDFIRGTAEIRPAGNGKANKWVMQEEMMLEATKHGLTLAEADYLRKPKGKTAADKINFTTAIVDNMQDITEAEKQDFKEFFKGYSFNKSHAVVYTYETFKNAKLKYNNPSEFYARVINNNLGDDLLISKLIIEAIQRNVKLLTPNRGYIDKECKAINNNTLQLGTSLIKGISNKTELILKTGKYCKALKEYLELNKDEQRVALGMPATKTNNKFICLSKAKGKGKLKYKILIQCNNEILTLLAWNESKEIKQIKRGSVIDSDLVNLCGPKPYTNI